MGSVRERTRSGQAVVFVSLSIVPTLALIGLVVDVGWAYWRHEAARTAAQSAAIGAIVAARNPAGWSCGNDLTCQSVAAACPSNPSLPPSNPLMNGCLYARQNGFTNNNRQTVVYTAGTGAPPVAGTSPAYWVSYTVTESIPILFGMVNPSGLRVKVRSTAGLFPQGGSACIFALDPSGSSAIDASGNPVVESTCGIWGNSTAADSMVVGGAATLKASGITLHGGIRKDGQPNLTPSNPVTYGPGTSDPLWATPAPPEFGGRCDSNGLTAGAAIAMPGDGYYVVCGGGMSVTGGGTLHLKAGVYILKNGSIDLRGGKVDCSDCGVNAPYGVMIYLTGGFSGITINGNMNVSLSAPTSGPYAGVLFFQDRSLPVGAFSSKFDGGATMALNGSLYFKTTNVEYSGGAAISGAGASYTSIVAYDVSFKGNSYFAADWNGAHTGIGLPHVGVIE